jgi:ATP-dependent RNA/DNA helicase IGHMBP2
MITLISETDMKELGKYPKYCFVRLTDFGAFQKIEECLIKMSNCEIHDYNINLLNVLLKLKDPTQISLPSSSDDPKFYNYNINSSQISAIEDSNSRKELSLIHGPPGTGKTTTIVELILKCVEKGQKILVCSHSNIAVDNVAEKLIFCKEKYSLDFELCRIGRPARLLESVLGICIDALVNKGPYETYVDHIIFLKSTLRKRDENGKRAIMARIRELQRLIDGYKKNEIFENSNVVLCTNVGAGNKNLQEYLEGHQSYFDVVIIDEAAQAPEYSCWIPILAGEKLIMAGDHKQLPPTVLSGIAKQEIFNTLFEKMNDHYKDQVSSMLQIQYRMNKLIMGFSSKEFYFDKLIAHNSVENRSLRDIIQPSELDNFNLISKNLIQVDTANYRLFENQDRKSFFNTGESIVVVFFIEYLIKIGVKKDEIGVITPYRGQVKLIKSKMPKNMQDIDVSSVDGFQGREKEVIIISLVRSNEDSNIGFVHDERRMNVALTRAKRLNILIWNSCNFQFNPFFKRLHEYFNENGSRFAVEKTDPKLGQ